MEYAFLLDNHAAEDYVLASRDGAVSLDCGVDR